jgi:hypothetical protein
VKILSLEFSSLVLCRDVKFVGEIGKIDKLKNVKKDIL